MIKAIPKSAMPVVVVLRRNVPKPATLPISLKSHDRQLPQTMLRWLDDNTCPMGKHPKSRHPCPGYWQGFADGMCDDAAVTAFFRWWDDIQEKDAQEAMDAIWPVQVSTPRGWESVGTDCPDAICRAADGPPVDSDGDYGKDVP
jgi:hypothetical protein